MVIVQRLRRKVARLYGISISYLALGQRFHAAHERTGHDVEYVAVIAPGAVSSGYAKVEGTEMLALGR